MLIESDLPRFELDGEQLLRPDFAGRGLANVAPSVLELLAPDALDGVELPSLDPSVLPEWLTRGVKTVVLVLADGLGHLQLHREIAAGNAPNLGELIQRATEGDPQVAYNPITSVFPTTTVAALGSVNSAVTPTEHGLLGYTLYLPEFEMVAEMIRWGPLNRRVSFADPEFGQVPESFFWAETMYARLQAAGLRRTFAVNPIGFAGTALTRMLHQSASYVGYVATSSLQPMVSRLVSESDQPTYIYAYWPTIDTISHIVGPLTPEHGAEVAAFDLQVGRLLARLPERGDTLIMLTADHGHVDTVPEEAVRFSDHPELLDMLRVPPAGERRAVYLHPKPGATLDVAAYARERLRDVAPAMLRDDAVELGLFGPGRLSERAAGRIGEVLLFPRGNLQLLAPPVESPDGNVPKAPIFRGLHGGLTAEEAVVPLVAVRI
jgi:Type I phosphodiesterase / nucleotide pyrophosphatase